ncbi:MAG: hypothetical protein FD165_2070 [Gammaproteobacteria bacterium]|nr:MAG: hypothetical protein FD165_2070 [Gammaproteobacteria bacterium]TND03482.1 MAG: hypothetical protein FD120_1877 [Gammaproteobacteria bacterium]
MAVEIALLKVVDLLVGALKYYVQKRKKATEESGELERRERLISEAIRELLSRRPNINIARARIEEARALGNKATEHLLRAEELLDAVSAMGTRVVEPRARAASRRSSSGTARKRGGQAPRAKKRLVKRRQPKSVTR